MIRFVIEQVRHRRGPSAALTLAVLLAALGFSVLTAASRTAEVRATGLVRANVRAAYDILVRPKGSATQLERSAGLVQDNYLSGIFGGITLAQYDTIRRLPGVDVAAPIANLGYFLYEINYAVDLDQFVTNAPTQLWRVRRTYVANGGLTRYADADSYVYITRTTKIVNDGGLLYAVGPHGRSVPVCRSNQPTSEPRSAFDRRWRSGLACFSTRSPRMVNPYTATVTPIATSLQITIPVLLSAIDPTEEDRLVGLDRTTATGRALRQADRPVAATIPGASPQPVLTIPVVVANRSFLDEQLQVQVERLKLPPNAQRFNFAAGDPSMIMRRLPSIGTAGTVSVNVGDQLGRGLDAGAILGYSQSQASYWQAGRVRYVRRPNGELVPTVVSNPPQTWASSFDPGSYLTDAPIDNDGVQLRPVSQRAALNCLAVECGNGQTGPPTFRVVGSFDPAKVEGLGGLGRVPLESYVPPEVTGADAATVAALHGQPLRPDRNIGGYLAQPPAMLTTLSCVRALTNSRAHLDYTNHAPISVIRIRVAGVHGVDSLSRARIEQVATEIHNRTGLDVDITLGSSPAPQKIALPAGAYSARPLLVQEGWSKKGTAVAILSAVDRKSMVLFISILIVCGLFVANTTTAAVSARRHELGVLACLGWQTRHLFAMMLGELALIGLVSGGAAAALATPTAHLLHLPADSSRALLAIPVALGVVLLAGFLPVARAARTYPAESVRSARRQPRRAHRPRTVGGLALTGITRRPARALLALIALAIGIAGLTMLLAITERFRGTVVGTLLGDAVAVHVRGVDYVAIATALALAAATIADTLYLNIRDRAADLATLHATGWTDRHLNQFVAAEALTFGLIGSLTGAAIGYALAHQLTGATISQLAPVLVAATLGGLVLTLFAALLPAASIRRLSVPALLAAEV